MSQQGWVPAPRRTIVPLYPMTFGQLLGRPFAALRHNPKVLIAFAVVTQVAVALLSIGLLALVFWQTLPRLAQADPQSPDFETILWGTIALTGGASIIIGIVLSIVTAVLQGVIAADVAEAALGHRATLRVLWARVRPRIWALLRWTALQVAIALILTVAFFVTVVIAIFGAVLSGASPDALGGVFAVVGVLILAFLAVVPLFAWLSTKLLHVSASIVLENANVRTAMRRSWRLTRGRFWLTLGVTFLVAMIIGSVAGIVSLPFMLVGELIAGTIAPAGETDASAIITSALASQVPQIFVWAIQSIALVVQGASAAFLYLDARMRYEGLDHALLRFHDQQDAGVPADQLGDPFAVDPALAVTAKAPVERQPAYAPAPGMYAPQGYPAQGYTPNAPGYPAQPQGAYPPAGYYPPQTQLGYPAQPQPGYATETQPSYPAQPQPGYPTPAAPAPYQPAPAPAAPPTAPPPAPPAPPVSLPPVAPADDIHAAASDDPPPPAPPAGWTPPTAP